MKMMNILPKYIGLFFLIFLGGNIFGQDVLTIDDAVSLALKNNFDVPLAQKSIQQALLNTDKRNIGLLPTVTANAGATYNLGTFWGKPNNAPDYKKTTGAATQNYNASINGNYLLYDGNFRKYNWDKFKIAHHLSEIEAKSLYEQITLNVHNTYYQIAKLEDILDIQQVAIGVSKHRKKRAEVAVEYGRQSRIAVLNAEVDINNDSLKIKNTLHLIGLAKRNLNTILGRDLSIDFEVVRGVEYRADLTEEELVNEAIQKNTKIQAINQSINLSGLDIKLAKTGYQPTVRLSASYGGIFSDQPSGFFDKQISLGLGAGVQVSWNIFDGGRTKIQEQRAIIAKETTQLRKQKIAYEIESNVRNAWAQYQNYLSTIRFQFDNIKTAEANFQRTQERFEGGQLTSVEFRQAQLAFINAQFVYEQAKYDAKLAELNLLYLSGKLVD